MFEDGYDSVIRRALSEFYHRLAQLNIHVCYANKYSIDIHLIIKY